MARNSLSKRKLLLCADKKLSLFFLLSINKIDTPLLEHSFLKFLRKAIVKCLFGKSEDSL